MGIVEIILIVIGALAGLYAIGFIIWFIGILLLARSMNF